MGLPSGFMEKPIYEYVLERLEATKGRWPRVAEGSGVSRRTLEKIARQEISDPGVSHIQKLADYFRAQEKAAA
jgi:transcriptional regulator with XRE-family HTH domain